MKKKRERFDIPIQFSENDLKELFEPFDPTQVRKPRRSPDRKLPIVLAHGIARPDFLIDSLVKTLNLSLYDFSMVFDRFHYFKGIASHLKKHGFEVYHTRVSFAAGVEQRAKDLREEILKILKKTGRRQVDIIAHSMGGLDARHMIVNEDMADKVATLTTIGTPHLGTSVADVAIEFGIDKVLGAFRRLLNMDGIRSCGTEACQEFNESARDHEANNPVIYQTYSSSQSYERTFLPFQVAWKILQEREGENDGLVSVKSHNWEDQLIGRNGQVKIIRHHQFPIPADHMDQMGWWNLNEIHKAGWWNMKALKEKNTHEEIIKNIYLKIAREVNTYA